jgi:hypothetical protein
MDVAEFKTLRAGDRLQDKSQKVWTVKKTWQVRYNWSPEGQWFDGVDIESTCGEFKEVDQLNAPDWAKTNT